MEESKRKNYTDLEIETFDLCLEKFKKKIECKITNKISNEQKNKAWNELTDYFNSMPGVHKRSVKQLKDLHKNLRKKATKNKANERLRIFGTGGGPFQSETTAIDERLVALGSVKKPLINRFDSDHDYHMETTYNSPFLDLEGCSQEEEVLTEVEVMIETTSPKNAIEDTYILPGPSASPKDASGDTLPGPSTQKTTLSSNVPSSIEVSNEQSTMPASYGSQDATSAISNKNSANLIKTPKSTPKRVHTPQVGNKVNNKLIPSVSRRKGRAAEKTAADLSEHIQIKKKLLLEEHDLNMKQKKEEHDIKMQIHAEKLKFWQNLNEKLKIGNINISDII